VCESVRGPNRNHIMLITSENQRHPMEYGNWRILCPRGRGRTAVFVKSLRRVHRRPYTAVPKNQKILATIHQFHMRLGPDRDLGRDQQVYTPVGGYSGSPCAYMVQRRDSVVAVKRARFKRAAPASNSLLTSTTIGIYAAFFSLSPR